MNKEGYKYSFIYKTINLITGQIYIGYHRTNNFNDGYIGCGITCQSDATLSTYFHNVVRKYGYKNFKREIIEENIFILKELKQREIFWIKEFNAHWTFGNYNLTWGGDGVDYDSLPESTKKRANENRSKSLKGKRLGVSFSKEHCQHISEAKIGKTPSKEVVDLLYSFSKNRVFSEKHREGISKSLLGRSRSQESRDAQSKTNTGKKLSKKSIDKRTVTRKRNRLLKNLGSIQKIA